MKTGKLPWDTMRMLISMLPVEDPDLVVGPSQGEDAAVIRFKDGFIVAHVDPITTGVRKAGYLAVHVAGNDIATRGVKPRWFMPVVLIPEAYGESDVKALFKDMGDALREVGGIAIGGHTEVTPGIDRPLIVMSVAGYTSGRVISTRDARDGDYVIVIGRIGGEGAGIIAWDFKDKLLEKGVSMDIIERAQGFIYDVSIVKVALAIRDYVNTMHDATEGGVIQALREVAVASGNDIVVNNGDFTIEVEVNAIARAMNVDPLRLLSSGCLIATASPGKLDPLVETLERLGVKYSIVGRVTKGSGRVIVERGSREEVIINEDVIDEIYKLWSQ